MKILLSVFIASYALLLTSNIFADELSADDRAFYIGAEMGIVAPVKSKFVHKRSKTIITLKKSEMYSGKVGYSFYPNMHVEFSATYQPSYKLAYQLPVNKFVPVNVSGNTKVSNSVYMLNLIYDLGSFKTLTPFVIIGGGIARIKVSPTITKYKGIEFFKVNKTVKNCRAWQVGAGISHNVSPNLSIDFAAKLQVAHNVRIDYETLDIKTRKFVKARPIKKPIGVGEYGVGFTYKFPFKY